MEQLIGKYLFRCWNISKEPFFELENIKSQQLYLNPVQKYSSDGEFEFSGIISESGISTSLCKELENLKNTNQDIYNDLAEKLTVVCGVPNIVGEHDYIEKLSQAFARLLTKQLNELRSKDTDSKTRKSLLNNIGMTCLSNSYPHKELLQNKGAINSHAVCCVYEKQQLIKYALAASNFFIIPKVTYSDLLPLIEHIFYKNDLPSKEHFCNLIISAGTRIRKQYMYENEFRILRIIGDGNQIYQDYQYLKINGCLKIILIPKKEPSTKNIKEKLSMLKAEADKLDIEICEEL